MAFPLSNDEHAAIKRRIDGQQELVVAAAIRLGGATISFARPGRHGNCLNWLSHHGLGRINQEHDCGFLTNKGRFVDREEAGRIVQAAGQGSPRLDPPGINPKEMLFSEDMWNDVDLEPQGPIDPAAIFNTPTTPPDGEGR